MPVAGENDNCRFDVEPRSDDGAHRLPGCRGTFQRKSISALSWIDSRQLAPRRLDNLAPSWHFRQLAAGSGDGRRSRIVILMSVPEAFRASHSTSHPGTLSVVASPSTRQLATCSPPLSIRHPRKGKAAASRLTAKGKSCRTPASGPRIGASEISQAGLGMRFRGCFCGGKVYSWGLFYKPMRLVTSEIREAVKIVMFAGSATRAIASCTWLGLSSLPTFRPDRRGYNRRGRRRPAFPLSRIFAAGTKGLR